MLIYLWIAIGSAIGGVARYWLSGVVDTGKWGGNFPIGILIVNITGSFIIGFFNTITGSDGRVLVSPTMRTFFMIGICGGYTTFSSFSLNTLTLAENGEWFLAGANIILSVLLCLVGVWFGHLLAVGLNSMKGN